MVEGIYWFILSWAVIGLTHEFRKEFPPDDRPQSIVHLRGNYGRSFNNKAK